MTKFLVLMMVFASLVCWADYAPGLYLRVEEVGQNQIGQTMIDIWEPVSDRSDALAKLPSVLAEHFQDKQYEARLHWHYLDKPCVVEIIATGTYNP